MSSRLLFAGAGFDCGGVGFVSGFAAVEALFVFAVLFLFAPSGNGNLSGCGPCVGGSVIVAGAISPARFIGLQWMQPLSWLSGRRKSQPLPHGGQSASSHLGPTSTTGIFAAIAHSSLAMIAAVCGCFAVSCSGCTASPSESAR